MVRVLWFAWMFMASLSFADMPPTCQILQVSGESVTLKAPKPSIVLFHNTSNTDIWLTHPVKDPSLSAGWTSLLSMGNWSSLALSDASFEIACIESKPGHEQSVPCEGMLAICQWSEVVYPNNTTGTFWIGEDKSQDLVMMAIMQRGFKLPSPKQ